MASTSPFDYDLETDVHADPLYAGLMATRPGDDIGADDLFAALAFRPEWQQRAACRGVGPDVFFIGQGGDTGPAKALCAGCEVVAECLEAAADTGIWGGLSAKGRRDWRAKAAR